MPREKEANLSLSLPKSKHFSLWVNIKPQASSDQENRKHEVPSDSASTAFLPTANNRVFPTHQIRTTQWPQGYLCLILHFSLQWLSGLGNPEPSRSLPSTIFVFPTFPFSSPHHFLELVQGRNSRVSLSLPSPITILPTRRLFSPNDSGHQSTKPKPKAALRPLEFLKPSLGCGSSPGHPLWALNY